MKKIELVLIGAGSRSRAYTEFLLNHPHAKLVGVVEPDETRRMDIVKNFKIEPNKVFLNDEDFFAQGKIADGVIITTMDKLHYEQALRAIELNYPILLEKPIALSAKHCIDIESKAKEKNVPIMVCHVLRYAPFFYEIKKILKSGKLGNIVTIQHNENINVFHFSHSYVRGSWRRAEDSSPIILAKSSHDFDIINWLVDSNCKQIASFGSLKYFNEKNAPENSAGRCFECAIKEDCVFNAEKIYLEGFWWNKPAVNFSDQSDEGIRKALKTGPYGRCVYKCDNDVCDNQVAIIEFENGVTATFNLSAFTNPCSRTLKIMCEKGEIRGDMQTIEVLPFGKEKELIDMSTLTDSQDGHGGGDELLLNDFIQLLSGANAYARTSLSQSVMSHLMAFGAEKSRLEGSIERF